MNESILTSIKKLVGISKDDDSFDEDIITHINTAFMILSQLGVGPAGGFKIEDDSATWSEYLSFDDNLESVKTFIHQKVKLIFDPPLSSSVEKAIKESVKELEWRLNIEAEQ